MNKQWKKWVMIFMLAALVCAAMGCGGKKEKQPESTRNAEVTQTETQEETEETEAETEAETEEETERDNSVLLEGEKFSYLTGLPTDAGVVDTRPFAVMLNNIQAACPQTGINEAAVIYEAPVEGGINRLMAIFEGDYSRLEKIGSVRSARTYFVYFAYEFRAFYVHAGQAIFAKLHLASANCNNISADEFGNETFYRTTDRKPPHNMYTGADRIWAAVNAKPYVTDYSLFENYDDYYGHYQFATAEPEMLSEGVAAGKVIPGYPYNEPWFEYNEEDGLYYRYQYGAPHADSDGVQIAVKNILIQSTPCEPYYDTQYLNFDCDAGGNGYYITNGKAIPVTWTKESEWGITRYFDAKGEEIQLNQGKTWVCVIDDAYENRIALLEE